MSYNVLNRTLNGCLTTSPSHVGMKDMGLWTQTGVGPE